LGQFNNSETNSVTLSASNCLINSSGSPIDIKIYPCIGVPVATAPTTTKANFSDFTWQEIQWINDMIAANYYEELPSGVTVSYDSTEKEFTITQSSGVVSKVALFDTKDIVLSDSSNTTQTFVVSDFLRNEDAQGHKRGITFTTVGLYKSVTKQHYSGGHSLAHYTINGTAVTANTGSYTHNQAAAGDMVLVSTGDTFISQIKVTDASSNITWYYFNSTTGTDDATNTYYTFTASDNVAKGSTGTWHGIAIDATNGALKMPSFYNNQNKFVMVENGCKLTLSLTAGSTVQITAYNCYNLGGYENSTLRSYLTGTIYSYLPYTLQGLIKPVKIGSSIGGLSYETRNYYDTLWALSVSEVNNTSGAPYENEAGVSGITNSRIMPIFTDNNSRIKKTDNNTGSANYWWLRSPYHNYEDSFWSVHSYGYCGNGYADGSRYVAFGFAL